MQPFCAALPDKPPARKKKYRLCQGAAEALKRQRVGGGRTFKSSDCRPPGIDYFFSLRQYLFNVYIEPDNRLAAKRGVQVAVFTHTRAAGGQYQLKVGRRTAGSKLPAATDAHNQRAFGLPELLRR
jgi:hypothetical protein